MKKLTFLLLILFSTFFSFSQNDSLKTDRKKVNRYVVWLLPSLATNIYGIAIGPIGSKAFC